MTNLRSSSEKKNILIFFPNIAPGGTERVIHTLLPKLTERYKVSCMILDNPPESPFTEIENVSVIKIEGIHLNGIKKYIKWLQEFRSAVEKLSPEVILSFGEVPITISSFGRALKLHSSRIRLIHNVRNHESTFLKNTTLGFLKKAVLSKSISTGDAVTGNSQEIIHELKSIFNCKKPTHVIYNPVDLNKFSSSHEINKDSFHIINIARLDPQKGQHHLINAFAEIQKKQPKARLSIIGDGPEKENLQKLVHKLQLENIQFHGWTSNVAQALSQADVFCLPSLWEGMPNVVLEALAVGTPVVSFDCKSGPKEILKDGEYGVLVEVGNEKMLSNALLSLLENPELRTRYSQLGKKRAQAFDTSPVIEQWIKVIEP